MKQTAFLIIFNILLFSCKQDSSNNSGGIIEKTNIINSEISKNRATVIIFLLPDCPASQNYSLTLNLLFKKYKLQNIQFYGVFPYFVKNEEIIEFQKEYQIEFPLLTDEKELLVKNLHAHIAPEAFIIDKYSHVLYQGRIDNWMYALGSKRTIITHHELQDALDAIVKGEKIIITKTDAVGCIID